ncbi:hypothetical protein SLS58_001634 [Diplodia intermedia]|uniref:Heterokaryon incompatibility domain-containing protein n=1 Tax=Diplodia intermedia TaxID=856260 RepID=A0ABR3U1P4_9PEZI
MENEYPQTIQGLGSSEQSNKPTSIFPIRAFQTFNRLECELEHTTIDATAPYTAISYVWGAAADKATIICQGKPLQIPRNLLDALGQIRCHSASPQLLWADAICINQKDDGEKNVQVPLMRVIFGKADQVLIWLGHDEAESAKGVFGFATKVFNEFHGNSESARSVSHDNFNGGLQPSSIWHEFSTLFTQPWFWRLWCFQEVILARNAQVMWGEARVPWKHLGFTAGWIRGTGYEILQHFSMAGVYNASLMYSMSADTGAEPVSLLRLLMLTQRFNVTKSVDRIFALLGIPTTDADPDKGDFYMQTTYEKPHEAVYEDFARKVIDNSQALALLSAVQHGPHLSETTKSWVPQWDQHYTRIIASADFPTINFCASRRLSQTPPRLQDQHLVVHGLEVDTVSRLSDPMPERRILASEHSRIQALWTEITAPLQSYPGRSGDLISAFGRTLTAGKDWTGNSIREDDSSHAADFAAFARKNFAPEIVGNSPAVADLLLRRERGGGARGDVRRYAEALYGSFCRRRFFVTERGCIGIGPACVRDRDVVCVLSGAAVPFILRDTRQGSV